MYTPATDVSKPEKVPFQWVNGGTAELVTQSLVHRAGVARLFCQVRRVHFGNFIGTIWEEGVITSLYAWPLQLSKLMMLH